MSERARRFLELLALYAAPPFAFGFFDAPRLLIFSFLWMACAVGLVLLWRRGVTWRTLWQGRGWARQDILFAVKRFFVLALALTALVLFFAPDRFLSFPLQRPGLWAFVMVLYPLLSALPQSLFFRTFFFARYERLFSNRWVLFVANGVLFGLAHALYGNMIAPAASAIAGVAMAHSFSEHRSLKWAALEHAAYGCFVFTLGIGTYFFKHA